MTEYPVEEDKRVKAILKNTNQKIKFEHQEVADINSEDHGNLHDVAPGNHADHTASLAAEDDDDLYQMAEEVFSSLTLDDWAVIANDNDPFDNRDPFRGGVKWVPGLGPPPASP